LSGFFERTSGQRGIPGKFQLRQNERNFICVSIPSHLAQLNLNQSSKEAQLANGAKTGPRQHIQWKRPSFQALRVSYREPRQDTKAYDAIVMLNLR
jgi:hypothetical protein